MKIIKEILYIFDKKQKMRLVELMILILFGTILETAGVTAIVPFISAIMYPEDMMKKDIIVFIYDLFGMNSIEDLIVFLAIIIIVVYILKNLYLIFMYDAQFRFVYNNQRRLSNKLMSCYMKQPYSFHLKHNSSELMQNIVGDAETFFSTVLSSISLITDVMVCAVLAILLFLVDKSITLAVSLMVIVFIIVFYRRFRKVINRLGEERREYYTRKTICLRQAFGGIKEVIILNREKFFVDAFDKNNFGFIDAKRRVAALSMTPKPIMETLCIIALMIVIIMKICRGVKVEYFVPTLSIFALAVIRMLPSSSRIATNLSNIVFGKASIKAVYEDLKGIELLEETVKNEDNIRKIEFQENILIDKLTFSYEGSDKAVLQQVNLEIPKNKAVAFVGASGAGKTTLADIILGVLTYKTGRIFVDGNEIRTNSVSWQKQIGYIPQNIYILDDTIRRNIAMAINDEDIDDKKIWDAVEKAQLKSFVESLQDGLDTVIGEHGARISGGQRQRIGIARALYTDPDILILDEATSALDNETENAVMEAIDSLNGKKTLIIIAHRLTTIDNCDIVYRISDGKVTKER